MGKNNFAYLFLGLLVFLLAEPFLGGSAHSGPLIQLALLSVLVLGVFSFASTRVFFRLGVALGAVALVSGIAYLVTGSALARIIDLGAIGGYLLLAIVASAGQVVLRPGAVDLNRLNGALCIYLLLGVFWTILFALTEILEPGSFDYGERGAGDPIEYFLYYSFVTLTTLGYGDVVPVHPVARTLSYLEAVIGQLYVAVLIASLVARYIASPGASRDPGPEDRP